MLNKLKNLFSGKDTAEGNSAKKYPSGYFTPSTGAELLAQPHRKKLLKQLWDNTSLPENVYEKLYLEPLKMLAHATQNVPATSAGEWGSEGGYLDLTIKFTAYSVRLAKGYMFPPGAAPEEQAAQNSLWNAVIFWSALFHHLPLLAYLEGELLDGSFWPPGVKAPDSVFRFRNNPDGAGNTNGQALAAFIASRLLPQDGVLWLSSKPAALDAMTRLMHQGTSGIPLIEEILEKAKELVCSPELHAAGLFNNTLPAAQDHVTSQDISPIADLQSMVSLQPAIDQNIVKSQESGAVFSGSDSSASPELVNNLDALLSSALSHSEANINLVTEELQQGLENAGQQPPQQGHLGDTAAQEDDTALLLSMLGVNDDNDMGADTLHQTEMPARGHDFSENSQATKQETATSFNEEYLTADPEEKTNSFALDETATQAQESVICVKEGLTNEKVMPANEVGENNINDVKELGPSFITWLSESIENRDLSINESDSLVHAVSGFIFISLPETIFKFINYKSIQIDKKKVQAAVEKMGILHSKNDSRFFRARIYEEVEFQGKFKKRSGYMIKASKVVDKQIISKGDSKYIFIDI